MNTTVHAVRVGLGRGWTELKLSMRNPQDITFYLVTSAGALFYLWLNRNARVESGDVSLPFPTVAMPSILGLSVAFGAFIGPAYSLATEREDGTLLRAKALPNGMIGYLSGQVYFQTLGMLPAVALLVIPSFILFEELMQGGVAGWFRVGWLLALGLLAILPLGMILGSVVKGPRAVGTWGMLPVLGLAAISGIFFPIAVLAGWLQVVAQVFPVYWLGLGMRSAFLPDSAAALEIGESWRSLETIGVLGAWAVAGLLLAPVVLRRMARRESGSLVEARRHEAMQRIG